MGTSELLGKPDQMLGVTYDGPGIPSRRSSNTPSRFMLRNRDKLRRCGSFSPSIDNILLSSIFPFRVAIAILLMYYSFGIIGVECFSGLKLKNCCG